MLGLITDRTQRNVYYRNSLSNKGWSGMTKSEKSEWLGNPFDTVGANLFACGPYYSSSVDLKYRNEEILATATTDGTYLYAISIIGEAADFANKVLTLSTDTMQASSVGTPQLAVYWHDDNGYEFAGASLLAAGSVTFDTAEWQNTRERRYLAVYVYVTTFEPVVAGDYARFGHVMLKIGNDRHAYIPYTEIIPTEATKGAYNYSDLNRVERAVAEISDRMGLNLATKTDWNMWDIPKETDMKRYIGNIKVIATAIGSTIVPPSSMNFFTYEQANNIESILNIAYESLMA